jgi:alkaline phosphatase
MKSQIAYLAAACLGLALAPAGAQEPIAQANDSYFVAARADLARLLAQKQNTGRAKNVILFIVDGMSIPTITASRILEGQLSGRDGESNVLAMERLLPHVALSKTYTHDAQVADSAATATAMVSGVKVRNATLGLDQTAKLRDCASSKGAEVTTIFELAEKAGLSTGIVTTARVTHATPAAAYAKTPGRDWEYDGIIPKDAKASGCRDIADQLVSWPAGNGFEVILGGGRQMFTPKGTLDPQRPAEKGVRSDKRNLIDEWKARYNDAAYVWNKAEFDAIDPKTTGHLLGLFAPGFMQYEVDRAVEGKEPSLAEMTAKAIDVLSTNGNGFVLMVEAGRVDNAHHAGNAYRALTDTIAASQAVEAAMQKVDPDETLIVLTADHSHVMTLGGTARRGNPILGIGGMGADKKPYTTLGYQNGPGSKSNTLRADLTGVDTAAPDFKQQSLVPLKSETHGGDDVAIFAQGPWAHLFDGVLEENVIFHIMAHASGLDGDR